MKRCLLLLLFILGCKTTPPLVYAPENLYPKATKSRVVIYFLRPPTKESGTVRKIVEEYVDGKPYAKLGTLGDGTYFIHQRGPGAATFVLSDSLSNEGIQLTTSFDGGKTYYISYFLESLSSSTEKIKMPEFTFDILNPDEGESTVHKLRMLETPKSVVY